ncbi:hypothetical protein VTK73DRAFT_163 [Phialemonium thermophilum]|uniref:Uncharacterized protein n=1 Tax=Phialemonium thermophilum TaxID=223376 RepID=A0ABR3VWT3_9PEZI
MSVEEEHSVPVAIPNKSVQACIQKESYVIRAWAGWQWSSKDVVQQWDPRQRGSRKLQSVLFSATLKGGTLYAQPRHHHFTANSGIWATSFLGGQGSTYGGAARKRPANEQRPSTASPLSALDGWSCPMSKSTQHQRPARPAHPAHQAYSACWGSGHGGRSSSSTQRTSQSSSCTAYPDGNVTRVMLRVASVESEPLLAGEPHHGV